MASVTSIVETPKGSGYKYDFEPDMNGYKIKKVLPAGMVFPFDFGFIPNTKGEDGDPLDIIIISELKSFPGCIVDCRIIGAIKANQTETDGQTVRNDRFLGVPEVSQLFKDFNDINDLPKEIIYEIESFFKNYNDLAGKKFEVLEHASAKQALGMIKKNELG